ncbi:ABC transporter substrate-binding protein [Pseudohalocynthiibacter aestuariivivens]|uniref:Amino acid ABC transporter substrate-binding protein n=1 Tax=Roseovarius pelagicus TaxID=2980108 RepID=A0ABY6D8U4_9RHOB|nr:MULTISPECIES: amino acid ABC transporter substrate-binding protein [Rhodobacterales]QIE45519.1 ABC transporter substrate-binding protein [Pseudohalocynthiibacter aestuariivivens]UXX82562.1 amino acid ABC transporter substrate-binding protein [Roseovarius pelagicus]
MENQKKRSFMKGLAFAALALSSTAAWAADPIRIGMTVSSAGNYALASQSGVRGVELWAKEVNAAGGLEVNGEKRLVELVMRDDRSDKQMVARVYESLILNDDVDLLLAPFGSTLTAAAATTTERLDKFLVVWSAASDALYDQGFKNMVSATQMPVSRMPLASMDLAADRGIKKIAIVSVDEPFPAGLAEGARALAEERGIEVVMNETYPKGTKDFSLLLQKARVAGADLFYPTSYEGDLISMVRQMRQMNVSFPMTFMVYASTPQFIEIGDDAQYIFSHTNFHPTINWDITAGMTRDEFLAAYEAEFPDVSYEPDFQTVLAYGAAVIAGEIIEKSESFDAAALKQAAMDLSGNVTVLAGPYEIDDTGTQLNMPFPVVQLQPGKGLTTVWPPEVAVSDPVLPIPAWDER